MKKYAHFLFLVTIILSLLLFSSCASTAEENPDNLQGASQTEEDDSTVSSVSETDEVSVQDGFVLVPDFTQLPLSEAEALAQSLNLTLKTEHQLFSIRTIDEPVVFMQLQEVDDIVPEQTEICIALEIGDPNSAVQNGIVDDFAGMDPQEAKDYFRLFTGRAPWDENKTSLQDYPNYSQIYIQSEILAFSAFTGLLVPSSDEDYAKVISVEASNRTLYYGEGHATLPVLANIYYFTVGNGNNPLPYANAEFPYIVDGKIYCNNPIGSENQPEFIDEMTGTPNYGYAISVSADGGETFEVIYDELEHSATVDLLHEPVIHENIGKELIIRAEHYLTESHYLFDTFEISLTVNYTDDELTVTGMEPKTEEEIKSAAGDNRELISDIVNQNPPYFKLTGNFVAGEHYHTNTSYSVCIQDGELYIPIPKNSEGEHPRYLYPNEHNTTQMISEDIYIIDVAKPYEIDTASLGN